MRHYTSADSIENAICLLNQFLEKGMPKFTVYDFTNCNTEIEIENRYKKLLKKYLDGEDERRQVA